MHRNRAWIAAIAVVALVVAGYVTYRFTSGSQTSGAAASSASAQTPVSVQTPVSTATSTKLALPHGGSLAIPANAVTGTGTVSAHTINSPAPAPSGMAFLGDVYDIEVSGAHLTGIATLTLPAAPPATPSGQPGPNSAIIAFYDPATHTWTPVPTTYDATHHDAIATSDHLSIWSAFTVDTKALASWAAGTFKSFLGVNDTAPQPTCAGSASAASSGVKATSTSGSLIKWCVGQSAGNTILTVADDREFDLELDYPNTWTLAADGWPDLDTAIADGVAKFLTVAPKGEKIAIVPGGASVTFTIPPGEAGIAHATPSSEAYLASAFLYGIDTLVMTTEKTPFAPAPSANAAITAIQTAFSSKDCLSAGQILVDNQVTSASSAVTEFWDAMQLATSCLGDAWEEAYGAAGYLTTFIVGIFSWLISGLKLVGEGLGGAVESAVYWQGYNIAVLVPAGAQPTLGIPWGGDPSSQAGYGQVRPNLISNGGDPTGVVQDVTWSSWGGPTATGTGISDYVGPNQVVATGTLESVTVVAFDLGTCNGKPAYQAIEWYFPQHGQTFDPGTYINMCTGDYVGE